MGAKQQRKRTHPATTSSPGPPATERIGDLNRKKLHVKITDPYSGRLSSGRDAAPDARNAAQNAETRTRVTAAANGAGLPPSQPPKRGCKHAGIPALSAPPPSSAPSPSHVHAGTPSAPLPPPPAWYPVPTAYPPGMYTHAPYYSAYPMCRPYGYLPPSQPHLPPPQ